MKPETKEHKIRGLQTSNSHWLGDATTSGKQIPKCRKASKRLAYV
jgi:hypothetical protein